MKSHRLWMVVAVAAMLGVAVSVGGARMDAAEEGATAKAYFEPDMDYATFTSLENQYRVVGFGRDTQFMCILMRSRMAEGKLLTMDTLFDTKAGEVIGGTWLPNCQELLSGPQPLFPVEDLKAAVEALTALQEAFKAAPYSEMTYRQLYDHDWAAMPSTDPVIMNIEKLEATGMQVPWYKFMGDRKKVGPAIEALQHRFAGFDLGDIMYTPAGPQFDDADIDAVQAALHEDHVLLKKVPDVVVQRIADGARFRVPKPGNNPMCCSTVTRTCVTLQNKVCAMCGSRCCLGSQWCD